MSKSASVVLASIPAVLAVALWFWATAGAEPELRRVSPHTLPSPTETVHKIPELWFERELSRGVAYSLGRVAAGYAIGLAAALPLGIAMGAFPKLKAMFSPIAVIGGYLPIVALVPLTIVWWGIGEKQKVGFLAIACFVYILPLILRAIEQVDDVYVQTARAQGASEWQVLWKVLVPVALPDLYTALHLAFGIGWTWIILAEVINAKNGVGYIINISQRLDTKEIIYLCLVIVILIAFLIDKVWTFGRKQLFPYEVEA